MRFGLSERRGCAVMGVARSTVQYEPRGKDDGKDLKEIREIALRYPRYGYRRIWAVLRRSGRSINRKRVLRLWRQAGLVLKPRRRRVRRRGQGVPGPLRAAYPRHVVTYDFMFVRAADGRRLKILTVVDEYTRESLAIAVGYRMTSSQVLWVLAWAFRDGRWPEFLRSDNGPEFIAEELRIWLEKRGVKTHHIRPASPWENAYGESFNDKLRTECLNLELFANVEEAQRVLEAWRRYYNQERPHSSLDYQTPVEIREAWDATRKEFSSSLAPGALRASRGEGERGGKAVLLKDGR